MTALSVVSACCTQHDAVLHCETGECVAAASSGHHTDWHQLRGCRSYGQLELAALWGQVAPLVGVGARSVLRRGFHRLAKKRAFWGGLGAARLAGCRSLDPRRPDVFVKLIRHPSLC